MSGTDLWKTLESALTRPPDEREAFLRDHLATDDLTIALELIAQADSADDFFHLLARDVEPARGAAVRRHEVETTPTPERIGPYRIVERHGVGGMGEVYRAERADGAFEQTVAIKLIRRSLDDPVSIARFRAERQILAQLEHPSIARLIDGGVTEDDRAYLVMEWVDGVPIDCWVAEAELTTRQRIRLFLDVCRAVEHAHRNLIIHRDIKPSNVLVDGDGRIKLLDFGIAKILEPDSVFVEGEASIPTGASSLRPSGRRTRASAPLTPRYAAPEQLSGLLVSTATDVYALGVVLYEILTGSSPFSDLDRGSRSVEGIERPSQRALRSAPAGVRPRQLKGDLDAIVLACLEPDAERRMTTVRELREDLERHLEARPVTVRRPSFAMRAERWVRRNRGTAAVALVALVVLGWTGVRLLDQYRATADERDKAQAAAEILIDLFRSNDPLQARDAPPNATEVLERGRARLAQLDDQPQLQAELANALGEVYRNVGEQDQAIELHQRALDIFRSDGAPSRQQVQRTLALQADALRLAGQLDRALEVGEEALELAVSLHGPRSLQAARTRSLVGRIHLSRRELEPARDLLESAIAVQSAAGLRPDLDLATTLNDLAVSHILSGDAAAAEPLVRRAIVLRSEMLGPGHPSIAGLENNLAALLSGRAQFAAAEEIYRRLVPQLEQRLGAEHLHTLNARRNLGLAILQQGRADAALPHLQAALEHAEAGLDEDHPLTVVLTNYVGFAHLEAGELDAAEAALRRGLEMSTRAFDGADPRQAGALNNLALLAERRGDLADAERGLRRALAISQSRLPEAHPQNLAIRSNLARVEHGLGRTGAAARAFETTLALQRSALPDGHPDLAYTLVGLSTLRKDQGDGAASAALAQEALEMIGPLYPAEHRLIISARRLATGSAN